ncbi:MAG TPA: AraC family transcriptional regulator [Ktedonobacteraceae bacterium]|nr:AraC family transcriptional regulator [Ktedonobacteraceae bacterium]
MNISSIQEHTQFWREPTLSNLELLRATYITHAFAPHIHDGYAIGVIESGAEQFKYRRSVHVAPRGSIVVINPGEMHTGEAATEQGWTYRMLYPDVSLLQRAAAEVAGKQCDMPFFPSPVVDDPVLAVQLLHLHAALEDSSSALERDSRFLWVLAQLILRHADAHPSLRPIRIGGEQAWVRQVRAYLEDHYAENVSLEQLASSVNLSPFHLLRVFRDVVGLPPHNYLTQVRVTRARQLLQASLRPVEVALAVGFTDQSHLTRHFKALVGVTPAQYAQGRGR